MATLSKEFRRLLENTVLEAREEAERGAAAALESFGVGDAKVPGHLDDAGKVLRRKLRAHGRQAGDVRRPDDSQEVEHLVHEFAYEHWHRMLFARFLAENGFLIEPESGLDVDLDFCEERARELKTDKWEIAAEFAQRMLPGIFRPDDPVLQLRLPVESRNELTRLLASLPRDVFLADDSLGWVYQFWQSKKKEDVNDSGEKIGADELAPVTQLFTEDYMVEFLLHNTLGAWWTAKRRAEGKSQPIPFTYLRLKEDGTPAAGAFEGWPKKVKELRVLDPCMGSGHFLVFALIILVRMRIEEEGVSAGDACVAVLRDNLFGLELDPRCTQIGAFNLALAGWKLGGHHTEQPLNLACSGLGPHAKKEDWLKLAARAAQTNALAPDSDLLGAREETLLSQKLKAGVERLYNLFQKAPVLGSLINPRSLGGDLLVAEFHELQPVLAKALQRETGDEAHELAVAAQGAAKAAEILAGQFTLVATNVPYLGREGHVEDFTKFADGYAPDAVSDLATLMLHRCFEFIGKIGVVAVVLPQNWWVGRSYSVFRKRVLTHSTWRLAAVLGEEAWQTFGNRGPNTILLVVDGNAPPPEHSFQALDVSTKPGTPVVGLETKARALAGENQTDELKRLAELIRVDQHHLHKSREARISVARLGGASPLRASVLSGEGCSTGDNDHFLRSFWELNQFEGWMRYCGPGFEHWTYCDNSLVMLWEDGCGELARSEQARIQNTELWNKRGVLVGRVRGITATLFSGGCFSKGAVLVCPRDDANYLSIFAFLASSDYENLVRTIDPRVSAATSVLVDVPFDLAHWQKVAAEKYPNGLPKPFSSDPTQWLFNGHPKGSDHPLQVAVARLAGYRWPRQTGLTFPDCPALGADGLEKHADNDGVVCFPQLLDEAPAATRLRALLADAYGAEWGHALERKLIAETGSDAESLEAWLVDDFFAQHCDLFHNRPFAWHIWDGRKDGFSVLLNYHKLAGADGVGARTLETLTYAYLGDWIARQKDAVAHNEAGAEDRFAAAQELQSELKKISAGEPPYDLFIRWKPLHQQSIGWQPDINDGVRLNIRPFLSVDLSRGKKGCGLLRVKPNIKWPKDKGKEPSRPESDFPWFWKWDEQTLDFAGNGEFDGNRWNDCHYTTASKKSARERNEHQA